MPRRPPAGGGDRAPRPRAAGRDADGGGAGATDIVVRADGPELVIELSEASGRPRRPHGCSRRWRSSGDGSRGGHREPAIQRQGADRILIQVPGVGSAQELKDIIRHQRRS